MGKRKLAPDLLRVPPSRTDESNHARDRLKRQVVAHGSPPGVNHKCPSHRGWLFVAPPPHHGLSPRVSQAVLTLVQRKRKIARPLKPSIIDGNDVYCRQLFPSTASDPLPRKPHGRAEVASQP